MKSPAEAGLCFAGRWVTGGPPRGFLLFVTFQMDI